MFFPHFFFYPIELMFESFPIKFLSKIQSIQIRIGYFHMQPVCVARLLKA